MIKVLLRILTGIFLVLSPYLNVQAEDWVYLGDYLEGKFYYNDQTVQVSRPSVTLHMKLVHSEHGKRYILENARAMVSHRLAQQYESLEYSIHEVEMSCLSEDYQVTRSTYYSSSGHVILDSQRTKGQSTSKELRPPVDDFRRRFCR